MKKYIYFILFTLILCSCNSQKEILYFQDATFNEEEVIPDVNTIKIRPEDRLSIVVSCKEPQIAQLLNAVESNRTLSVRESPGQGTNSDQVAQSKTLPYTVDSEGNINFPLIGKIHVAGLTREQVAEKIRKKIIDEKIVNQCIVTVEFVNLHYSVLGEVKTPGSYSINNDHLTLLDALSKAGDLTIFGRRDRVFVIREVDGKRIKYLVDLRNNDLFNSPAYYLQQNDVIYVEPNNTKIGQSTINENNWKSVGLWVSIASLLTSVAVLIFK